MDEFERLREFRATMPALDAEREERALGRLEEAIAAERTNQSPDGARGWTFLRSPRWLAAPAVALLLGGAASLLVLPADKDQPVPTESPSLATLLGGGEADYDPADSPAQLAARLEEYPGLDGQLVVRGTIDSWAAGRTYGGVTPDAIPTLVMTVRVEDVLQGKLPEGSDGSVYVEFEGTVVDETENAVASLSKETRGAQIVAYLAEMRPEGIYPGADIDQAGAGRPVGQPLFQVFTPQGFYVDDPGSDDVLQPRESAVFPEASLSEFEPADKEFPPGGVDPRRPGFGSE